MLTSLSCTQPFSTTLLPVNDFTADLVLATIEKGLQSNEAIAYDDLIDVTFQHVDMPIGGGRRTALHVSYENARKHLKCIVRINVESNLCLPAAIYLGKVIKLKFEKLLSKEFVFKAMFADLD